MAKLYIENTFFEDEILNSHKSLKALFSSRHALQLQFLPLLYANKEDTVVVTHYPDKKYLKTLKAPPNLILLEDFISKSYSFDKVSLWAPSKILEPYLPPITIPSFEIAKKVHCKTFCFENSKKLPLSTLLHNEKEVEAFFKQDKRPMLLKTLYGRSGSGHFLYPSSKKNLQTYLKREFSHKRPVIGQLLVEKCLDFSTQWEIDKESITLIGKTIIGNTPNGVYQKTYIHQASPLLDRFYQEHLDEALKLLKKVQEEGFFGPIGIDAMVYKTESLHHQILEINARKTMSLAALNIAKKYKCNSLAFEKSEKGLLPSFIKTPTKRVEFSKNLILY